ncbi:uncharacterized protein HaLaN_15620, partial [Haematococcus lacustris]
AKFTLPQHGEGPGSPGWRWGFHSCNGFHDLEALKAAGGIQPLWRDLMALHEKGVFSSARRFYALFQLHSTPERVVKDNQSFGVAGWNNLLYLGPRCALLLLDNRMERQQLQVIDPGTWSMVDAQLRRLPSSVQHLVVVATVPVVYPKLPVVESAAKYLSDVSQAAALTAMMQKTGLAAGLLNQFGAVEILDDLMDHWNADVHVQEKADLLVRLQNLAQARQLRVSFLSGDVHVAGYGYTRSVANIEPANDFRFMPQIVSSAIGNSPPPAPVVTALTNIGGELKINTASKARGSGQGQEGSPASDIFP